MSPWRTIVAGLLGGFIGVRAILCIPTLCADVSADTLTGGRFFLLAPTGRWIVALDGSRAESTGMWFVDGKSRPRLSGGVYNEPGHQGLLGLMQRLNGTAPKVLFREAGTNDSGVLVFKDNPDRDRIVFGLALNDPSEEPFLIAVDHTGHKTRVFGDF